MSLTLEHFTEGDEQFLRELLDKMLRWEKQTGAITEVKVDARQGGFSLHVKFEKKSDVVTMSDLANLHDRGIDAFFLTIRKLLDIPDDYDPDAEGEE